jgi:erythromycin esterase
MADNIKWILNHTPTKTKLVLWAHNYHIQKLPPRMGTYLQNNYGENYLAFGFIFNKGEYNAYGDRGFAIYKAMESYPGSYEYFFHKASIDQGILNLHLASKQNLSSSWLLDNMQMREIGAYAEDGFRAQYITKKFDDIIYVEKSTPTKLF